MRVFLTGAGGFLGSRILERLLRDGHEVQVLVRSRGEQTAQQRIQHALGRVGIFGGYGVIEGDILRPSDWMYYVSPMDVVFHCASSITFSHDKRDETMLTNVQGTKNLLELAKRFGAGFVYVSTAYVCGDNHEIAYETLDWLYGFRNPYEESKRLAEQAVADAYFKGDIPWALILRPSIIAGEILTGIAEAASGYLGYMYGAYKIAQIVGDKYPSRFEKDPHGKWIVPVRIPCDPMATINIIPVDTVVNLMIAISTQWNHREFCVFHLSHPYPPVYSYLFERSAWELGITGMKFVFPKTDGGLMGGPIGVLNRLYGSAIADYIPYVSGEPRFDQTNVRSVLPGFESMIPDVTEDYIALQMQYAMKHVYSKEP